MALITIADAPVISGRLTLPLRGPSTFDGKADAQAVPVGSVVLACVGGLHLTMAVDAPRSGVVLNSVHLWLVGGAGGLGKPVSGAFRFAQLRDPVNAIMAASGETLSPTVDAALLSTRLDRWSIGASTASAALSSLCTYASTAIGQPVNWRTLADGTIWIGVETWPAAALDATDEIAMIYPSLSKAVASVTTPTIAAGCALEGVGNVAAVQHWISPHAGVQSWLFTDGAAASEGEIYRRNVRSALGLNPDPLSTPQLDRLALYPARVDAGAADGSTVDVTPVNPDIEPHQGVPFGYPGVGVTFVPHVGAMVRVGWSDGDPSKIYAVPAFDLGFGIDKLVLTAGAVIMGAEGGAQLVALSNLVTSQLNALKAAIEGWTPVPNDGGAALKTALTALFLTWPGSVAATKGWAV